MCEYHKHNAEQQNPALLFVGKTITKARPCLPKTIEIVFSFRRGWEAQGTFGALVMLFVLLTPEWSLVQSVHFGIDVIALYISFCALICMLMKSQSKGIK